MMSKIPEKLRRYRYFDVRISCSPRDAGRETTIGDIDRGTSSRDLGQHSALFYFLPRYKKEPDSQKTPQSKEVIKTS